MWRKLLGTFRRGDLFKRRQTRPLQAFKILLSSGTTEKSYGQKATGMFGKSKSCNVTVNFTDRRLSGRVADTFAPPVDTVPNCADVRGQCERVFRPDARGNHRPSMDG